jgi:hypothetical protein
MKKKVFSLCILLTLLLALAAPALAQSDEEVRLRISKIFGYSSLGNNAFQGSMRLRIQGPETLAKVVYYIDGEVMGEANQDPFELTFNTGSYALGKHTLLALATTTDGRELRSNELNIEFVTPEEGLSVAGRIAIPIAVVALVASLIGVLGPALMGRGKFLEMAPGTERNYGYAGGAICPRCSRPFPVRALAPNLGPGLKFDRCPFCGKVGVMRRRSLQELRRAEQAELEEARRSGAVPTETEEEKLRRELDNSRYL